MRNVSLVSLWMCGQSFMPMCFKDSRNYCLVHDENCIAGNAILVLQEMRDTTGNLLLL